MWKKTKKTSLNGVSVSLFFVLVLSYTICHKSRLILSPTGKQRRSAKPPQTALQLALGCSINVQAISINVQTIWSDVSCYINLAWSLLFEHEGHESRGLTRICNSTWVSYDTSSDSSMARKWPLLTSKGSSLNNKSHRLCASEENHLKSCKCSGWKTVRLSWFCSTMCSSLKLHHLFTSALPPPLRSPLPPKYSSFECTS